MKKNPFSDILYKLIYPTSLYFTVITLFLYIGGSVGSTLNLNWIPTLHLVLIVLGFSFVLSASNILLPLKKLHISLRIALHFLITAVGFYVLFFATSSDKPGTASTIVILLIYTVVYAVICAVVLGVNAAVRKSKNKDSDYSPIYDKRI